MFIIDLVVMVAVGYSAAIMRAIKKDVALQERKAAYLRKLRKLAKKEAFRHNRMA